jgi:hypothetical protein
LESIVLKHTLAAWSQSLAQMLASAALLIGVLAVANMAAPHGSTDLPLAVGHGRPVAGCHATNGIPGHVLVRGSRGTYVGGSALVARTFATRPPKHLTVLAYCR